MDGNLIGDDGCNYMIDKLHDSKHIYYLKVTSFVKTSILERLHEWLSTNIPSKSKGKKKGGSKKKKKK